MFGKVLLTLSAIVKIWVLRFLKFLFGDIIFLKFGYMDLCFVIQIKCILLYWIEFLRDLPMGFTEVEFSKYFAPFLRLFSRKYLVKNKRFLTISLFSTVQICGL